MSTTIETNSIAPFLWRLIRYRPWLYILNILAWIAISLSELIPGFLAKAFFDALSGAAPFGLNVWTIVALVGGTAVLYAAAIFSGAMTDIRHRFTMSALLRLNLLDSLLKRPGADALPGAVGEVINTFRDDAESVEDTISWMVDQVSIFVFVVAAIGTMLSIWSLRLNGAALACFVQFGLKATCGTLRLSAQREAIFSAPFGEPPCSSTMSGCLV